MIILISVVLSIVVSSFISLSIWFITYKSIEKIVIDYITNATEHVDNVREFTLTEVKKLIRSIQR